MSKVFQIALGVVAALGGFVDIGELVFNSQAGAEFGYQLLWTVPIGVVGIATYAEMCGRVATIHQAPGLRRRAAAARLRPGAGHPDR